MRSNRVNAIFDAAEKQNEEEVKRLIKKDRSLLKKKNQESETLLHIVSKTGNQGIARVNVHSVT